MSIKKMSQLEQRNVPSGEPFLKRDEGQLKAEQGQSVMAPQTRTAMAGSEHQAAIGNTRAPDAAYRFDANLGKARIESSTLALKAATAVLQSDQKPGQKQAALRHAVSQLTLARDSRDLQILRSTGEADSAMERLGDAYASLLEAMSQLPADEVLSKLLGQVSELLTGATFLEASVGTWRPPGPNGKVPERGALTTLGSLYPYMSVGGQSPERAEALDKAFRFHLDAEMAIADCSFGKAVKCFENEALTLLGLPEPTKPEGLRALVAKAPDTTGDMIHTALAMIHQADCLVDSGRHGDSFAWGNPVAGPNSGKRTYDVVGLYGCALALVAQALPYESPLTLAALEHCAIGLASVGESPSTEKLLEAALNEHGRPDKEAIAGLIRGKRDAGYVGPS